MRNSAGGKITHTGQIYRYLYRSDGVAQQKLANDLDLSMPTVLQGLKELRRLGLIREDSTFASTGGRKARVLRIDPDARIAIGMEISLHHVSLAAIDLKGHILCANRIRHPYADSYFYYATLGRLLEHFLSDHRLKQKGILGLGIALEAIVSTDHHSIQYAKLTDNPSGLFEKLKPHLSLPFLFFNSANCGGFAEWWNRSTDRTILYLSLSNTVGGAMIDHNALYTGDSGKSCEFGHMTLIPRGRRCFCGKEGCVTAYLNASLLSDHAEGKMDLFFARAEARDPECSRVLQEYLQTLSILVHNLRMMYDCDIVLGGYVGAFLAPWLEDFREMVRVRSAFRENVPFLSVCRHKYHAAAMGAALYFVNRFIQEL